MQRKVGRWVEFPSECSTCALMKGSGDFNSSRMVRGCVQLVVNAGKFAMIDTCTAFGERLPKPNGMRGFALKSCRADRKRGAQVP